MEHAWTFAGTQLVENSWNNSYILNSTNLIFLKLPNRLNHKNIESNYLKTVKFL